MAICVKTTGQVAIAVPSFAGDGLRATLAHVAGKVIDVVFDVNCTVPVGIASVALLLPAGATTAVNVTAAAPVADGYAKLGLGVDIVCVTVPALVTVHPARSPAAPVLSKLVSPL